MLPSPPGPHMDLTLEPSPSYSPISTPSASPKPPPSPPLYPTRDDAARKQKVRELKSQLLALEREQAASEAVEVEVEEEESEPASLATPPPQSQATPQATPQQVTPTVVTPPPQSAPTTTADTADNLALRSTLRLLMLQRERAKRDIQNLERMREEALREPVQFVEYIAARGRKQPAGTPQKPNIFDGQELPRPQEVYRCPNIEWAQYRILGQPLNAMHETQLKAGSSQVPQNMQTGGLVGLQGYEDSGVMRAGLRLFDQIGERGAVLGR
ncbi:Similar to hypothetical protein [Tuber melanosporum Mel28]; acc. no. XP_002841943 [Pyronema omphalodes CBS 100304]|uniref:Uncharacterized protein n=1 Tax=Pyronema omphalodes (strain CBS 100304) TaxID=1076935 RepID=U4LQS6_PYROM|nr:Similar to hypothetical protein [Tuber melanosporum Mel28]; acc. no. XP_002841943 [Pyronema omphalodes CBS 100304]